jgi:hypothetical protein
VEKIDKSSFAKGVGLIGEIAKFFGIIYMMVDLIFSSIVTVFLIVYWAHSSHPAEVMVKGGLLLIIIVGCCLAFGNTANGTKTATNHDSDKPIDGPPPVRG